MPAKKRTTQTPRPIAKKEAAAATSVPIQDADPVTSAMETIGAIKVRADKDGVVKGLTPSGKYFMVCIDAGDGYKRDVQFPPSTKLAPPIVRKSVLILMEGPDSKANPIK